MRTLRHRFVLAATIAASLLAPTAASAVTVDQIVALAKAGVTDTVILALIDRDKTIFALEPDELVSLKADGVSEPVLLAMLASGREEGERAAQAESDLKTALYLAERSPGPEVLIIGHGPDAQNAERAADSYSAPPAAGYLALPYAPELRSGYRGMRGQRRTALSPYTASFGSAIQPVVPPIGSVVPPVALRGTEPPAPRALCRAQVNTATSTQPLTFVTECPPAMQAKRPR